jgi:hypothetical protein
LGAPSTSGPLSKGWVWSGFAPASPGTPRVGETDPVRRSLSRLRAPCSGHDPGLSAGPAILTRPPSGCKQVCAAGASRLLLGLVVQRDLKEGLSGDGSHGALRLDRRSFVKRARVGSMALKSPPKRLRQPRSDAQCSRLSARCGQGALRPASPRDSSSPRPELPTARSDPPEESRSSPPFRRLTDWTRLPGDHVWSGPAARPR